VDIRGKGVELVAIALSVVVNIAYGSYQIGKVEQRVSILEQLRAEGRVEVADKLADIKVQIAETNRKLDRVLERGR
jgi:hypothetical protein